MAPPPVNPYEAARNAAHEELREVFYRLGYDLGESDDMRRLAEDLRWVSERRTRQAKSSANMWRMIWVSIAAVLGPVATVTVQWFVNRWGGNAK